METKIKWNEGDGYITATYEGSGSGSASISSDVNEGIDREQSVKVETTDKSVSATLNVKQIGLREVFETSDGFIIADGGTFNVLKGGGSVEPTETYTRLTFIETDGTQYFNTGYVVKETDTLEMDYINTSAEGRDNFLFGALGTGGNIWISLYDETGYARFGSTSSASVTNACAHYKVTLKKGTVLFGSLSKAPGFAAMPENPLNMFSGLDSSGSPYNFAVCKCMMFRITGSDGVVMELRPCKRDSDGAVGMLDVVSGKFYVSEGEPFIAGNEIRITDGYELIDATTFNDDKMFDSVIVKSDYQIEVMWTKASASGVMYLYGAATSPHTASVTGYLASNGSWRWGSKSAAFATLNTDTHYMTFTNGSAKMDLTSRTFTKGDFETPYPVVLGGYIDATGYKTETYKGNVSFFRIKDSEGNYLVDWFPCKRTSDGFEGFWDCLEQEFVES